MSASSFSVQVQFCFPLYVQVSALEAEWTRDHSRSDGMCTHALMVLTASLTQA